MSPDAYAETATTRFSAALTRAASSTSRVCTASTAGTGLGLAAQSRGELGVVILVGALRGRHRRRAGSGVERSPPLLGLVPPRGAQLGGPRPREDRLGLDIGAP